MIAVYRLKRMPLTPELAPVSVAHVNQNLNLLLRSALLNSAAVGF